MKRLGLICALCALAFAATASAAETRLWPWKDKTPPDPALVTLSAVTRVTASLSEGDKPILTVTVEATAPAAGYSELELTPRIGDPKDLVFAFDAKGRPPQDLSTQVETPVTITVEYADSPVGKVGVIEVYAESNCKAFSLKDNQETDCAAVSLPQ